LCNKLNGKVTNLYLHIIKNRANVFEKPMIKPICRADFPVTSDGNAGVHTRNCMSAANMPCLPDEATVVAGEIAALS
jgi:hypothetical protein